MNKKCEQAGYHIAVDNPIVLIVPTPTKPKKVYKCRGCGVQITEEQALRTFEELEKAICISCEAYFVSDGKIQVMAFE